jgi:hypothetical protein
MPATSKKKSKSKSIKNKKSIEKALDDITKLMESELRITKDLQKKIKKLKKLKKHKSTDKPKNYSEKELEDVWEMCEDAFGGSLTEEKQNNVILKKKLNYMEDIVDQFLKKFNI